MNDTNCDPLTAGASVPLTKVSADTELEASERDEAARILAALEPIHGAEGLTETERFESLAPLVEDLLRFDEAVNGPLPSDE